MAFIDAHTHLIENPAGLDRFVESDDVEQIWLMQLPYTRRDRRPRSASAKDVLDVAKRYPGLFIPFGAIDHTTGPDQVDRMHDQGFVGLKTIRPPKPYDDPSYFPIYERAQALRMPILFHTGVIAKAAWGDLEPHFSLGPTNMRPSMLDAIGAAFPDLTIIHGHMGFPWLDEMFESLYYYPRMFCCLCGYIDYRWLIDNLDRRCGADDTIADRVLFATDSIYGREGVFDHVSESATFMEQFIRRAGRTYQWGTKVDKIMIENARRVFADG